MAKSDLTTDEIVAKIEQAEQSSYGIYDQQLTEDRAEALRFYNGENVIPAPDGRSQVIARDVLEVVESAIPQLLRPFVSGDEVVKFEARSPSDEKAAELESAYVNYLLEKADFFTKAYTFIKDGLLSKNSYIKVWYEENEEVETENYKGLTDDQLTMLTKDEQITVIEHTEYPDEITMQQIQQAAMAAQQQGQPFQPPPTPLLHDVKIEIRNTVGCIEIDNVAPEDILIGQDTKTVSLQEANFVQHRALMTQEEIEENGWKVPESAPRYQQENYGWEESNNRDLYGEADNDSPIDQYLVKDTYFRLDGELKRYVIIGHEIIYEEDAEIIPFVSFTPHVMPHRHIGMSYADMVKDIQLVNTVNLRGMIDAQFLANNPRFAISDRVNLSDMLQSRPGGIVRVQGEPTSAIQPLITPTFPATAMTLMEYMQNVREKRTGITAYNQGLDANSLNKTATGVNQIMQASQMRLELVSRVLAVSFKELFMLVHRLVRKYYTRPDMMKLNNEWVPVDPREWKERKHMTIAVGLGTGNRDQQLMHLGNLLAQQLQMIQMGLPVVQPQNIYETVRQLVQNAGFKQPDQFVTNPAQIPPQPPQENPMLTVEKMKLQADQQKFQAEAQLKQQENQQKAQLDIQKFQAQAEIDKRQAEQQLMQEQLRSQNDLEIERQKLALEAELERYKAELKAQTDVQIAQIQAQIEAQKFAREEAQKERDAERQMNMHKEKIDAMTRPKTVIRDESGRAQGIQ